MAETLLEWTREHPPRPESLSQTLAGVAERARGGEGFRVAVREFLDEFALRHTVELRAAAISERPAETGDQAQDAFLAALAEHLAARHGLARPGWATEPRRFLSRFTFVSDVPGFRAVQIAQSPAAFRRRGIFLAEGALDRC